MSTEKEDKLIPDDCDIIQWIEQESDIRVLSIEVPVEKSSE